MTQWLPSLLSPSCNTLSFGWIVIQATRLGQLPKPYGWHSYFNFRFSDADDAQVAIEPALVDGLSYPLSFVYALQLLHAVLPDLFKRLGIIL
jgi:hypothetical protein